MVRCLLGRIRSVSPPVRIGFLRQFPAQLVCVILPMFTNRVRSRDMRETQCRANL